MTGGELGLICTAIAGAGATVGGIIKLLGKQIVTAIDAARTAIDDARAATNRNTDATLKFVESAARLEVKLDATHAASEATSEQIAVVVERVDEISGVHRAAEEDAWRTPPGGYSIHKPRAGTKVPR